jgi:hypothetical protein
MKLLQILMQVYATVYSVRPDNEPYESAIRRLDRELELFRAELDPRISGGPKTVDEDICPALYLQTGEEELRIILHHPSFSRAGSPDTFAKNLEICLSASKKLLTSATTLKNIMCLDTTWYYSIDYLVAIFTTLFYWTQKQDQMSSAELQQVRAEMDQWLEVMGDVGKLLGMYYHLYLPLVFIAYNTRHW